MDRIVFYEFPEDTLKQSPSMPHGQAVRLMESLEAQGIACCMEQADGRECGEPIVIRRSGDGYQATMDQTSWDLVQNALARTAGNQARAAKLLGLKRTTFVSIVKRLSLTRSESRRASA